MPATPTPDTASDVAGLSWLLDAFVTRTSGVAHAVVVSADGLPLLAAPARDRARTDQLAAIAAGLSSLTAGASTLLDGGGVRQTVVDMVNGYLVVAAISTGGVLIAVADADADLGLIGYEVAVLTERVGAQLSPALRSRLASSPAA